MGFIRQNRTRVRTDFGYPMNLRAYFTRGIIWGQRQLFSRLLKKSCHRSIPPDFVGQDANDAIRSILEKGEPCLVARFGCVEFEAVLRGYDISRKCSTLAKSLRLFTGGSGPFWWDNSIKAGLLRTAGVFPATDDVLMRFSERSIEDARQLDVLGSWNARELEFQKKFFPGAKAVRLDDLLPFFFKRPWSMALKGKHVLVVHPFDKTIRGQYEKRGGLFLDPLVLPDFQLTVYRPVTSFLGLKTPFRDWFEALEKMCGDIAKLDFDVALLGCGAYGMPLGAFIKRDMHKQAVHLGGATQLLFGIKGRRWDSWPAFSRFYNDNWTRAGEEETPVNFKQHEGGAYW